MKQKKNKVQMLVNSTNMIPGFEKNIYFRHQKKIQRTTFTRNIPNQTFK